MTQFKVALALAISYADLPADRERACAAAIAHGDENTHAALLAALSISEQRRVHAAIVGRDDETFQQAIAAAGRHDRYGT